MKWFSREFASRMEPDQCAAVVADYQLHISRIASNAPASIRGFASIANFHDGLFDSLSLDGDQVLRASILCGDLQVGYYFIDLELVDADVRSEYPDDLERILRGVEVLYEEFDERDGGYELRVLLEERGEIVFKFTSLNWSRRPASPEDRDRISDRAE
jgi:hypothetical protein